MNRLRVVLTALLLSPAALAAQAAPSTASLISLDGKLNVDGGKHLKGAKKLFVPLVILRVATKGSLFVVNQGRFFETDGKTAKAKGKFVVAGLDKAYLQSLAKQVQDDFVARLRAEGYTVITYDDVKGSAEVVGMKRYKADDEYGMPTGGGAPGSKNTYLVAFPSDEQAIDPPFQGYPWGFRKLLKELDATMMVPEFIVDAPLLTGAKKNGVASRGASVNVFPDMMMYGYTPITTAGGAWGSVRMKDAFSDLGDDVGEIGEAKDDSPKFANALSAGLAILSPLGTDMQAKSGTWGLKVNREKYTASVLRGAMSFNAGVTATIVAESKK